MIGDSPGIFSAPAADIEWVSTFGDATAETLTERFAILGLTETTPELNPELAPGGVGNGLGDSTGCGAKEYPCATGASSVSEEHELDADSVW